MAGILALAVCQENDRITRNIRPPRTNPFDNLTDTDFIKNFRLTKSLTKDLIEELQPYLNPKTYREDVIPAEVKVLCALNFFASGAYQLNVGNDYLVSISQQSASNCIRQVVDAMNKHLLKKYIKFPTERREQDCIKQEYFDYCGISGALGAIDCTHVSILAPSDDGFHNEKNYVNRKGWRSLNVQIVCDMHMRILDIVSRFPGCSHDAFIWRSCNLRKCFHLRNYIHGNGWLLGDSGYPWEQWLHTPFSKPQNHQERTYNAAHAKGQCVVERVNGVLKSRFRCLSRHRVLHYEPEVAGLIIINACVILHNICINSQLTIEVDIHDDDLLFNQPADS